MDMLSEKRQQRLKKNRESARECRRRKKEHVHTLEAQLAKLESDNLDMKLKLKVGEEARAREEDEIANIKSQLDQMVTSGEGEGEILATMDVLKTKFADYGRDRTSAAVYHLDELEGLLMPTVTTRTCIHALLTKEDDVTMYQAPPPGAAQAAPCPLPVDALPEPSASEPLWATLVKVIDATREQQAVLGGKVDVAKAMDADLHGTLYKLSSLRTLLCSKNESLEDEMAQIQRILTPTQTAKFILWVSRNSACMHMLNQLWTHIHEEGQDGLTSEITMARGQSGVQTPVSSANNSRSNSGVS